MNLTRKGQRNRLVGQLTDYMKDYQGIIVVLCGITDGSEYEELCGDVRRISPQGFLEAPEAVIRIVRKDKLEKKRTGFLFWCALACVYRCMNMLKSR